MSFINDFNTEKIRKKNICIVGAGHVGLVTAACFSHMGHKVICVDNDKKKIASLNKLKIPFYEPELESLVKDSYKKKNLIFSSSLREGVKKSEIIFIAVGTPPQPDGSADLTSIEKVAIDIAKNINSYKLIVEKSTVPVQTGQKIKETINRYRAKCNRINFDIASNPEFLREGKAVNDFFFPERIVIGVETPRAEKILKELYMPIKTHIIVTDISTAELIKHACNSFLAMKISFINAIARICDLTGADVKKVAEAMGMDSRIGKKFLNAGVGYGGFCFPKDLEAFIYIARKLGYEFELLKAVKEINESQKTYFVEKIKRHLWILKGKNIGILGLSFKPNTDDMRFAPSIDIIDLFLQERATVSVYDPYAMKEAQRLFKGKKNILFGKDIYNTAKNCDCLCFLTEWEEFLEINFKRMKRIMRYPLIADGRNMFNKDLLEKEGFTYIGIGR